MTSNAPEGAYTRERKADGRAVIAIIAFLCDRPLIHIEFLSGNCYLRIRAHCDESVPCKPTDGILLLGHGTTTKTK
jgi:hypothetical protein